MKHCPTCKQEFETGTIFCPMDGEKLVSVDGDDPLVGELIDNKYLVEEKVGRGATATVYRATHVQLELPVALKVMHARLTQDKTAIERFRREAIAGMQIRHPNAIAVLDFAITQEAVVYAVTEFLSGITLREHLANATAEISLEETNLIMQQICAAVAIAHRYNIIHRDLKPDNIFLHRDRGQQTIKVLDFGIAKMNELDGPEEESPRLTRQGFVLGTPLYMSPEQCQGKDLDQRSDIYSLGVMLYELLTGTVPFNARSYSSLVAKKLREKPKPIHEIRGDIPPVVNAVAMHALCKKADERPENVQLFARELEIAIRAVTESEFMKVFQNASDQELDAAILLAGEPGRHSGSSSRVTGKLTKIERRTDRLSPPPEQPSSKQPSSEKPSSADMMDIIAKSLPPVPDPLRGGNDPYSELLQFTNDAPQLLRQEMLRLTKEINVLLQSVIPNLESDKKPDNEFFDQLRSCVDALRAVMYHLHRMGE